MVQSNDLVNSDDGPSVDYIISLSIYTQQVFVLIKAPTAPRFHSRSERSGKCVCVDEKVLAYGRTHISNELETTKKNI